MNKEVTILRTSRKGIEIEVIENDASGVKWNIDTTEHDKQIRAEVIEEFRKFNYCKVCEEKGWDIYCEYCRVCQAQEYIAEQLKEQNK